MVCLSLSDIYIRKKKKPKQLCVPVHTVCRGGGVLKIRKQAPFFSSIWFQTQMTKNQADHSNRGAHRSQEEILNYTEDASPMGIWI